MKSIIASWTLFILSLGLGVFCVYVLFETNGASALNVLYIILMAVSFPLISLIHEAGHIFFGAMVKIKAVPDFGKKIFGWSSCKIIPKTDRNLKHRIAFTASGGLVLNALTVILGVISLCGVLPAEIAVCILPSSFYLFAFNALPLHTEDGKTDGLVVWEFLKETDSAKVALAVLTVQTQVLCGKKIEDIDENILLNVPVIREDDPAFISLTQLRYEYYSSKGDTDKAERYKERFEQLKEYI